MLSEAQREILDHIIHRAAQQMFCGNCADPDIQTLVQAGLMRYCGSPGFLPNGDGYYTITEAGRKALEDDNG